MPDRGGTLLCEEAYERDAVLNRETSAFPAACRGEGSIVKDDAF